MYRKILQINILFAAILLSSCDNAANRPPQALETKTELVTIKSIEMGDYCWLITYSSTQNSTNEKRYLVDNACATKNLCLPCGESAEQVRAWHNKQLKIFTAPKQICEHNPPCGKNDPLVTVPALIGFEIM